MTIPLPKQSNAVQAVMNSYQENMTVDELTSFMVTHGFSDRELSELLGMTVQGVRLWKAGDRKINMTVTKLIRLFIKLPHLMKEF